MSKHTTPRIQTPDAETPAERDARIEAHAERMLDAIRDPEAYWQQHGGDGPREHTEPGVDSTKLIAALPEAIDQAMKKTLPGEYTPELAAAIATDMITELNQPHPLTAAERGPEWMAKWGCPEFCAEEHGTPRAMECHSTAPVESPIPAAVLDSSGYSTGSEDLPWMTAQVVVNNDKAQAYGRQTNVWLGYGVHLAEISPATAREALDAMRAFTVQLAAVVDFADQVAADDFEGDPEIARLDREAEDRRIAARTAELLADRGVR